MPLGTFETASFLLYSVLFPREDRGTRLDAPRNFEAASFPPRYLFLSALFLRGDKGPAWMRSVTFETASFPPPSPSFGNLSPCPIPQGR
jgi:hypothetical protein